MEKSNVAVFDSPGAYLYTEIPADKRILLRIRYEFVDIMCEVNPYHKPDFKYDIGKKVLYVKVMRAIYGCIKSAMLWYNFYVKTLKYLGLSINTYNICVANKTIY